MVHVMFNLITIILHESHIFLPIALYSMRTWSQVSYCMCALQAHISRLCDSDRQLFKNADAVHYLQKLRFVVCISVCMLVALSLFVQPDRSAHKVPECNAKKKKKN